MYHYMLYEVLQTALLDLSSLPNFPYQYTLLQSSPNLEIKLLSVRMQHRVAHPQNKLLPVRMQYPIDLAHHNKLVVILSHF